MVQPGEQCRWSLSELGSGTVVSADVPVQASGISLVVPGITGVTVVATGTYFALALRSDCSVWTWGSNGRCLPGP